MKSYIKIYLKVTFVFVLSVILGIDSNAQQDNHINQDKVSKVNDIALLGDTAAFNKMVIQDISYAIIGENSPVSGIEVDLSKAEVNLSAMFPSKKSWILGMNLKAGGTDRNFNIFRGGNNINSTFEGSFVLHWIPKTNSAKFYPSQRYIAVAKNLLVEEQKAATIDTFYMAALLYNHHIQKFDKLLEKDYQIPKPKNLTIGQKKILYSYVVKLTGRDMTDISYDQVDLVLNSVQIMENYDDKIDSKNIKSYNDKIVENYNRIKKKVRKDKGFDLLEDEILDKKIANVSDLWSSKFNHWYTFSPIIGASKINLYRTELNGRDTNLFDNDYHLYGGGLLAVNLMKTIPKKRIYYGKISGSVLYTNNLNTLRTFNYTTATPLYSQGEKSTDIIESGNSYNYADFRKGVVGNISGEFYWLPLRTFIPGWYLNTSLNFSNLYNLPTVKERERDFLLVSLEAGAVFNINNKAKSKNVVSICPYFRFEDITDSKRTLLSSNVEELRSDFYKRNLSFGFRIGIPISINHSGS